MSEEPLSEEDKDAKLMQIIQELSEIGLNKEANQLFKKLAKKITFAPRDDWINEQVCSLFPKDIDVRCIAFCCSPRSPCPYRAAVLKKLGWTMKDYIKLKTELGEQIKKRIENKN